MAKRRRHDANLNSERRRLAEALAAYMQTEFLAGTAPSKFCYEASARHGLRAGLCLRGHRWDTADHHARMVVQIALQRIHATRPSWLEAQSVQYQDRGDLISRERCLHCRAPLPSTSTEWFCSRHCKGIHRTRQAEKWALAAGAAAAVARGMAA